MGRPRASLPPSRKSEHPAIPTMPDVESRNGAPCHQLSHARTIGPLLGVGRHRLDAVHASEPRLFSPPGTPYEHASAPVMACSQERIGSSFDETNGAAD